MPDTCLFQCVLSGFEVNGRQHAVFRVLALWVSEQFDVLEVEQLDRVAGLSRLMLVQRNISTRDNQISQPDAAAQHRFPKAAIELVQIGRNPNRSYAAPVTPERRDAVFKHLQEVRQGSHLELLNDPNDGWELMANGDAPTIQIPYDMPTLSLLLRELEDNYRVLTSILGNPASPENRKRIAENALHQHRLF